jgi:hypothetical protein
VAMIRPTWEDAFSPTRPAGCGRGKHKYDTHAEAFAAMRSVVGATEGNVYYCTACSAFHWGKGRKVGKRLPRRA